MTLFTKTTAFGKLIILRAFYEWYLLRWATGTYCTCFCLTFCGRHQARPAAMCWMFSGAGCAEHEDWRLPPAGDRLQHAHVCPALCWRLDRLLHCWQSHTLQRRHQSVARWLEGDVLLVFSLFLLCCDMHVVCLAIHVLRCIVVISETPNAHALESYVCLV